MMKRKLDSSENTEINKKKSNNAAESPENPKTEMLENQSDSDKSQIDDKKENVEENESVGSIPKKKTKTSFVWSHFTIRLADDQKTEFAHCNYCTRYSKNRAKSILCPFVIKSLISHFLFSKYKLSGKSNGGTGNLNVHLKTKHQERIPEHASPVEKHFVSSVVPILGCTYILSHSH